MDLVVEFFKIFMNLLVNLRKIGHNNIGAPNITFTEQIIVLVNHIRVYFFNANFFNDV